MPFSLEFVDRIPLGVLGPGKYAKGRITIGEMRESFCAALDVLSKRDYMTQWVDAVERLERGYDSSAVVTCYADRGGEIIGMWWVLHREAGSSSVRVHNQLILRDQVGDAFGMACWQEYLPKYERIAEDGGEISEWATSIQDLRTFKEEVVRELARK